MAGPAGSSAWPHRMHGTCALCALPARPGPPARALSTRVADRVVVRKAERKLYLMKGNTVLRTFKVALGL